MKKRQLKFPNHICVKFEADGSNANEYLVIIGSPDDLSRLDADDGDKIATYTLNGPVKVFRQHPRLEK